jgi:hypothetical protein
MEESLTANFPWPEGVNFLANVGYIVAITATQPAIEELDQNPLIHGIEYSGDAGWHLEADHPPDPTFL